MDTAKELRAIREFQRKMNVSFRKTNEKLEKRIEILEKIAQANETGKVEVPDSVKLQVYKALVRSGKPISDDLFKNNIET